MDFRDRLFELRRHAGLSQEELANLLGLSRQAVQKWEAGTSRPDMDNLVLLADYFHVTLDYLVTGREPACPPPPLEGESVGSPQPSATVIHHYYHEGRHYEYKSKRTLFGLPLIHVNVGTRNCWARGIIAVGNIATGVVALGGLAAGLFTLGGVSLGLLLALGGFCLGAVSVGGVAVGILAWGGVALGWLAVGGVASGVYAAGGVAAATEIAVGNVASAPLAIGLHVDGPRAIILPGMKGAQVTEAVQALDQACQGVPAIVLWTLKYCIRLLLD